MLECLPQSSLQDAVPACTKISARRDDFLVRQYGAIAVVLTIGTPVAVHRKRDAPAVTDIEAVRAQERARGPLPDEARRRALAHVPRETFCSAARVRTDEHEDWASEASFDGVRPERGATAMLPHRFENRFGRVGTIHARGLANIVDGHRVTERLQVRARKQDESGLSTRAKITCKP